MRHNGASVWRRPAVRRGRGVAVVVLLVLLVLRWRCCGGGRQWCAVVWVPWLLHCGLAEWSEIVSGVGDGRRGGGRRRRKESSGANRRTVYRVSAAASGRRARCDGRDWSLSRYASGRRRDGGSFACDCDVVSAATTTTTGGASCRTVRCELPCAGRRLVPVSRRTATGYGPGHRHRRRHRRRRRRRRHRRDGSCARRRPDHASFLL